MRILIAEEDPALANFVRKRLESEHYAVDISHEGDLAKSMACEMNYDLVVLDLKLAQADGVAILRHLRAKKTSMPILVLTGRNRVEDRVECLDLGADDYMSKPFSFAELSARIRALLRRSHLPVASVLNVIDLKLDRVERRVERAGKRIELTSKEFGLLEYLMLNAGRRVTRAMIIEHVWNLSFDTCTNVVDVYVNYKNVRVSFGDLFYANLGTTGSGDPVQLGAGVQVGSMPGMFTQGSVESTGVSTDVAIQGEGFFVVQKNGATDYTRAGNFAIDKNNFLVTQDGAQVMGYPAVSGTVTPSLGLSPLQLGAGTISPPTATGSLQISANLDAGAAIGNTFSTPVTIFDSLGTSHVLTFDFAKTAAGSWNYSVGIPAGDVSGSATLASGSLTFDGTGKLTAVTPTAGGSVSGAVGNLTGIAINGLADGAADMTFDWNFFNGTVPVITQVAGASSTSSTQQGGSASGTLVNFSIGSDGTVTGSFSNGRTAALGQIALAEFGDVQGLQRIGSNLFTETLASGQAVVGSPGTGGRGSLSGGALELSNVDIATEFANLIVAQRAFEANAKAVTTFDQITQDTINLKQG